ncbi:DNA-dependent RNA polymerase II [Marasmius sp. AFHP31]|nr:DNA-dependent RNA polymerase II [Marasmius sp. AFHP31]
MNPERERLNIHPPAQTVAFTQLTHHPPGQDVFHPLPPSSHQLPLQTLNGTTLKPPSSVEMFSVATGQNHLLYPQKHCSYLFPSTTRLPRHALDEFVYTTLNNVLLSEVDVVQDPYSYDDAEFGYDEEEEEGYGEITQDDFWTVISSFFEQFPGFEQAIFHQFGQIYSQEARLRNPTYSAPLHIEKKKRVSSGHEEGGEMVWETENDSGAEGTKVWIGKVPIMLLSTFCILRVLQDQDLYDLNECPYDSGGYFFINGSENVLITQERMATNHG